jgi:acyl-CoA thioesterase FadM
MSDIESMSEIQSRLLPGDAQDELTLPADARYREEGRSVRFDECGRDGRMRAAALLRHAQDAAWLHSEQLEYGRAWYEARGVGWVVRGIDLIIDHPPHSNETITVTTSLAGFRHVMARRHTRLFASSGRVIADAAIDWVMTDRDGRPSRFPKEFESFVDRVGATFLPIKIPAMRTATPSSGQTVVIPLRTSDIDPLGHVNHAAWLEVVEEALTKISPEQLTAERRRVRLEYLAVTEGERAEVHISRESESGGTPNSSEIRIDVHDEHGVPLVRGLFSTLSAAVPDTRHTGRE